MVVGQAPTAAEASVLQPIVSAMIESAGAAVARYACLCRYRRKATVGTVVLAGPPERTGEASGVVIMVASGADALEDQQLAAKRQELMTAALLY